jgi:hypothetical protein
MEDAVFHLETITRMANILNTNPNKQKKLLALPNSPIHCTNWLGLFNFRGTAIERIVLDAGLYADNKDIKLFPMVFSRTSGHEFTCVKLNLNDSTIFAQRVL